MTADDDAIRALIRRWHDATAAADVDAVLALMTDDAEFLVPGREPMRGREAFAAALRAILATHRIRSECDVVDVQACGGLAVAVTRLAVRIEPLGGGEAIVRSGHAMSVFRRDPAHGWRLARDANLLLADASPTG